MFERIIKYIVALVPIALTALYVGLTFTAEPEVPGRPLHGIYDYIYNRWILVGLAITLIMLIAAAVGDLRHRRGH